MYFLRSHTLLGTVASFLCDCVKGHYGEVLKGTYYDKAGIVTEVAIKRLKKTMTEKFQNEFEKEFKIMIDLKHPHIVGIIGRSDDPSKVCLLVLVYRVTLLLSIAL